jgi:hypothetical protein
MVWYMAAVAEKTLLIPLWPFYRTIEDGRVQDGVLGERRREVVE